MSAKAAASTHGRLGYIPSGGIDVSTGLHLFALWQKGFPQDTGDVYMFGPRDSANNQCRGRITNGGGFRTIGFHQSSAYTTADSQTAPDPSAWQHYAILVGPLTSGASTTLYNWFQGTEVSSTPTLVAGTVQVLDFIDVINTNITNTNDPDPIHVAQFGYWTPSDITTARSIVSSLQTTAPASVDTPVITDTFASGQGGTDFLGSGITFDAADNPSFGGGGGSVSSPVVIVI